MNQRAASGLRPAPGLADLFARLWRHLGSRRRKQFVMLAGLVLLAALAEIASLSAVIPFLTVLAAPDVIFDRPFAAQAARSLGIESAAGLVLPLTITFVGAAIVSAAVRLLLLRTSTRFVFATGSDLSVEVYRRTLYQPYSVHVSRSSSQLISGITQKVGGTMLGILMPTLNLLSAGVLIVAILAALIAIEPRVAAVAVLGFGGSYAVITWRTRMRLRANSRRIAHEQTQLVKALQEGLGGIRDVLLDGTQPVYCDVYRKADQPLRDAQGANVFMAQSPRFLMEALGMVLIASLAYGLSRQPGGLAAALPVLGALALGAQRLLPALQQAYAAWAGIAGSQGALRDTVELLDQPVAAELLQPVEPLEFRDEVRFRDVGFRFSPDGPWVLERFNLRVGKGARVGFVGSTGGGKSTTMDLFMGLLSPTEGEVLVDGEAIAGARVRAWQRTIAHVPQSIFLADTTVAENIALGVPRPEIDFDRVREAARSAHIAEFIEGRPGGYDAVVGERGIRLSGGQRQRIGIARALYRRASVLVLDEATSALDNRTEQSVLDSIESLDRNLTILIIAHRLTTVQRCDTIVELEQGRIVAQGAYGDLLERSPSFRHMAGAS